MSRRLSRLSGLSLLAAALALTAASAAQARRPSAPVRISEAKKPRAAAPPKAAVDKAPGDKVTTAKDRASDADSDVSAAGTATTTTAGGGGKTLKTKTYNFNAMDVEGKLKTPQLLYFLDRVKLELDMSAPDKRSFMKELEKSADDGSL